MSAERKALAPCAQPKEGQTRTKPFLRPSPGYRDVDPTQELSLMFSERRLAAGYIPTMTDNVQLAKVLLHKLRIEKPMVVLGGSISKNVFESNLHFPHGARRCDFAERGRRADIR